MTTRADPPREPTPEETAKAKLEERRRKSIQRALHASGLAAMALTTGAALAFWFDWQPLKMTLVVLSVVSIEALVVSAAVRFFSVRRALKSVGYVLGALLLVGVAFAELSLLTDKPKRFLQLVSELKGDFQFSKPPAVKEPAKIPKDPQSAGNLDTDTKACVQVSMEKRDSAGE